MTTTSCALRAPAADEVHALAVGYALGERGARRLALAHLQELDLALAHLALAAGLDGLHIGLVDPLDASAGIAEPGRHRQRVEQRAPGERVAHQLAVLVEDAGEVALAPGDVAQAQDGAPAGRPPVRLDMAARRRLQQRAERPAVGEQRVEAVLELLGRGQVEPLAELQQLGVLLRQAGDAAERVRHHAHALALLPEHQHLRLGLDDGLGRQQVLAQLGHLLGVAALRPRAAAHGAIGDRAGDGAGAQRHGNAGMQIAPAPKAESPPPSAMATTSAATTKKLASRRSATSRCGLPKLVR